MVPTVSANAEGSALSTVIASSPSTPADKMNVLSSLPVEVQEKIYKLMLQWFGGPSPSLLKAARCNKVLYEVAMQTFRRVNTFYVQYDGDALKRLSPTARREILNITFVYCDFVDPADFADLFDGTSKATSIKFLFNGRGIDYQCCDSYEEIDGFYPHQWFRTILPKFKFLKSITLICPVIDYPFTDEESSTDSEDLSEKNEESIMEDKTLNMEYIIELADSYLGIEAVEDHYSEEAKKIVGDARNNENFEEEGDFEDSDIPEIEKDMFVWTAKKGEYLRWDQED